MKTSKMIAMLVLGCAMATYAAPAEDFATPTTVIEGQVMPTVGATPAIVVNNVQILLSTDTVIRAHRGLLKPSELRAGMMVRVEGITVRGALLARTIYVLER